MFYVYILQSIKDDKLYIGCTNNLKQRFALHNKGGVESTRDRIPFRLIHYEAFLDKHDAFVREQWLKTGWGRNQIEKMLYNYLSRIG